MTKIEWTDESWNPVTGCSKISIGCKNCYAERIAKRLAGRYGYPKDAPFKVTVHIDKLDQPLRWKKPRMIFVCSMGDLFHEDVSDNVIGRVYATIMETPQHTYQILTKRPQRAIEFYKKAQEIIPSPYLEQKYLSNIWFGVSVENTQSFDRRVPLLKQIPAKVRFVSFEPLLENIRNLCLEGIDWAIVGGESGHNNRPMHLDWARVIRDHCEVDDVPFFMKQVDKIQSIPLDLVSRQYPRG